MPTSSPNASVMIVLAYLWPLALVPLLVEKNDPEVQWHAKHGIVLMVAEIVVLAGFGVVTSVISLATFGLRCVLQHARVVFLWIAILAIHVAAIVHGINGRRLLIPGVSEMRAAFRIFFFGAVVLVCVLALNAQPLALAGIHAYQRTLSPLARASVFAAALRRPAAATRRP